MSNVLSFVLNQTWEVGGLLIQEFTQEEAGIREMK